MKPANEIGIEDLEIGIEVELTFTRGKTHATLKDIQKYPATGMSSDYIFEQHLGWNEFQPKPEYAKNPETERWFNLPEFILKETKIIPLINGEPMGLRAGEIFQFMKSCSLLEKYYEEGNDGAEELMNKLAQRLVSLGNPQSCSDEFYRILKIQLDKLQPQS